MECLGWANEKIWQGVKSWENEKEFDCGALIVKRIEGEIGG